MLNRKILGIGLAGIIIIAGAVPALALGRAGNNHQQTAIGMKMKARPDGLRKGGTEGLGKFERNPLSKLVTAGTITQDQLNAIKNAIKDAKASGKTLKDVLDGMVSAGTINQAQEDAILKTLPNGNPKGRFGIGRGVKNPFGSLVTAGTITQDQLNAIMNAMKDAKASGKTIKDVLDGLVTAGTINQSQEDAILRLVPDFTGKFPPGGMRGMRRGPQGDQITDFGNSVDE